MFIRKKHNRSGSVSVQVLQKIKGQNKLIKTIGSSSNQDTIAELYQKGQDFISTYGGQQALNFFQQDFSKTLSNSIQSIDIAGIELLFGQIYDSIGFNAIDDDILRQLVLVRISHPGSKLKTSQYLRRYFSTDIQEDKIYRHLDKIHSTYKEKLEQISYDHTLAVLGGVVNVVFYDVTTIYFQIDDEDQVRKRGFSKEGRHQNPQIVLGLLVGENGYPLAYSIHEGNKFEGHTMLPILDAFRAKYELEKIIVIADSGLMSAANTEELQSKGYDFILGARIKNETNKIQNHITSLDLSNGQSKVIDKSDKLRLIINYSEKRAKKDYSNREKGLARLEKKVKTGKLTKSSINNRGYNKYLKMVGEINMSIDMEKFQKDAAWDGLKGYLTNTSLTSEDVIENYSQLWKIEKAFRVSKNDLKIRPIYHRLKHRIEAHIAINFVAYKVYKELERLLEVKNAEFSCEQAIEIAKTIYAVNILNPFSNKTEKQILLLNQEQKKLAELFNF